MITLVLALMGLVALPAIVDIIVAILEVGLLIGAVKLMTKLIKWIFK